MKTMAFGQLEQEIMEIVWEHKACTARDVLTTLEKNRKLAYTTVATILERLCGKGLLIKEMKKSRHIYKPNISKESYTKHIASSFLATFIGSFGDGAIASFADSIDKLPKKKREYFLGLLEEYERNK